MEVFADAAQLAGCVSEVVVQVQSIFGPGFLGLLACRVEELLQSFEEAVDGIEDLVGEGGGFLVRAGGSELVGQSEDGPTVDVSAIRFGGGAVGWGSRLGAVSDLNSSERRGYRCCSGGSQCMRASVSNRARSWGCRTCWTMKLLPATFHRPRPRLRWAMASVSTLVRPSREAAALSWSDSCR